MDSGDEGVRGTPENVKEHAKSKKLDSDVAKGRAGVAVGAVEAGTEDWPEQYPGQEEEWGEPAVNAMGR